MYNLRKGERFGQSVDHVLNAISRPVVLLGPDRRVEYANPAALEAVGREGKVRGLACEEFFGSCPMNKPGDACTCEELSGSARRYVRGRYESAAEPEVRRAFDVESSELPDGKGYVISLADISTSVEAEEMLERYAEGMTVLYELTSVFLTTKEPGQAMEACLEMLREHFSADLVAVAVPVEGAGELEFEYVAERDGSGLAGRRFPLDRSDMPGFSYLERCPSIVTDYSSETHFTRMPLFESSGFQCGICVSMAVDESATGVLCFMYRLPRQAVTAELWYMNAVANTLAIYIEKERSLRRLKESEAYLSSVLEGIGDGVIVVERDFRVKFANRGFASRLDMFQEEMIGSLCHEVTHNVGRPCFEEGEDCPVKAVFETGRHFSTQHTHRDADGKESYVRVSAYPILDPAGNVVAAVETVFDISDRVGLEQDLEKRVKELEEFYDMAVGRELRMIELKEDIEKLNLELERIRARDKGQ
jgi:PAS domain S-box-containing protein